MPNLTCPHCGQLSEFDDSSDEKLHKCAACGEFVAIPCVTNRFPGAQAGDRFQFSLRKLMGVMTVMCVLMMLVALALPALQSAGGHRRRNGCINNLKNLGLALHNHHDIHNRLPLASSRPRSGRPGSASAQHPAGYSWHVALLPFMEETLLYDQFFLNGNHKLQGDAFDSANQPELGCNAIGILRCPTDSGDDWVDRNRAEYGTYPTKQSQSPPARSNYVAFVASHFANDTGLADPFEVATLNRFDGNGMFPFPLTSSYIHQGLGLKAVTDGTSKTVMLTETRESGYAAWIDGQATWVVGAWQGASQVPSETGAPDGFLGWNGSDLTSRAALGLDPLAKHGEVYLTAARFGAKFDRTWGPSSEHTGGAVNHLFTDGHVQTITPDIDREVYLRIISRSGAEPFAFP